MVLIGRMNMPTLDECMEMVWKLGKEKKWGTDVATKIYYAMIELGEAGDIWKHRGDTEYLKQLGLDESMINGAIAEELIDTIYYCLHAMRCLSEFISPDEIFLNKHRKNKKRKRVYLDDKVVKMPPIKTRRVKVHIVKRENGKPRIFPL